VIADREFDPPASHRTRSAIALDVIASGLV
jgi:hypothetical protein